MCVLFSHVPVVVVVAVVAVMAVRMRRRAARVGGQAVKYEMTPM